jgi:hypothetical protein
LSLSYKAQVQRYVDWFHELDAWTEYWDVYHPETRGRFYFGDGGAEPGLLTQFLPHKLRPPAFAAWTYMALTGGGSFAESVHDPPVAAAIVEVDNLLARLFAKHFGEVSDPMIRADYLEGMFRFATNRLPPATERDSRIADTDPRKRTAGRHTLDGDIMWFAWALHTEAAELLATNPGDARRALILAGIATGCSADYAWHGHRRTRPEYARDVTTADLLRSRGMLWATDFAAAASEVHTLFRFREWGHD